MIGEEGVEEGMTIWHVQELYTSEGSLHKVLPYDFMGMVKSTLRMKNGIWQVVKILLASCLTEKAAVSLCEKKNR